MFAVLRRRGCRFYFGDLVCKWWQWMLLLTDKVNAVDREELITEMLADLPEWLHITREDIETMMAATSAVHSHTHVWWCQASILKCSAHACKLCTLHVVVLVCSR